MTNLPLVVLCDDEPQMSKGWCEELKAIEEVTSALEIVTVKKGDFEKDVQLLEHRRSSLRQEKTPDGTQTIFDRASVLIVDYDLYAYTPEQLLTGDSIAYLARSFSSCGYIVGVNQDRIANPFDLTLIAHRAASTDLSIGSDQVANPGLWTGDPAAWNPFRPWYWPVLTERAAALEELKQRLVNMLDEPLEQVLGLPRELFDSLPRRAAALLDVPSRPETASVPLREWVEASQMGLRPSDKVSDNEQLARIAAARLAKWFEHALLPGQDILVDAPHLVDRRPGLLDGDTTNQEVWQGTAQIGVDAKGLGLRTEQLGPHQFTGDWVSRPAWFWPQIALDSTLDDALDAPRPEPRMVFAEDMSKFIAIDAAMRYTSDVEPPFNSRWVAPQQGIGYLPAARLAAS
jgi:hypothetical protein